MRSKEMPWHELANTEGRMGSRTLRGRIFLRYLFERNIYWSKTGVKKTPTLLTEYVVHSDILGFLFLFSRYSPRSIQGLLSGWLRRLFFRSLLRQFDCRDEDLVLPFQEWRDKSC